jgi:hypothetical protein
LWIPTGQLIAFCPPLIIAAEAVPIPARLHLLKTVCSRGEGGSPSP